MSIVLPTESDKNILLAYVKNIHLKHEDDNEVMTVDVSGEFFPPEDVVNIECACDSALVNLGKLKAFFTAGRPLVSREIHDTSDVGDVEPFSSVSVANAFSRQSPSIFFNQYRETLKGMRAELLSSRDTMRRINAKNAFIWTTNVSKLQQWFSGGLHRGTPNLGKQKARVTGSEESSLERSKYMDTAGHNKDDSVTEGHCVGKGGNQNLSDTCLLSLEANQLPSEMVKNSYAKFIQACVSLISWLTCVLDILNGVDDIPKPGKFDITEDQSHGHDSSKESRSEDSNTQVSTHCTRTVTVRCFEIHDAYQIYALFVEQAAYFFQAACTQYDARVQRRLLQPSYFHSVRELIDELTIEIDRLKRIAQQKPFAMATNPNLISFNLYSHSNEAQNSSPDEQVRIFLRPPLNYFCFLRASLQLYISICLSEDDLTSLLYFQHLYRNFLTRTRDVVRNLQRLPKPCLCLSRQPRASDSSSIFLSTERRENGSSQMIERDRSNYCSHCEGELPSLDWEPSMEERGQLYAEFEAYWSVREKVHSLSRTLRKDIRSKDSTHRTRVLALSVQDEKGPAFLEAEQGLSTLASKGNQQPTSLWAATKYSFGMLSRIFTCQTEVDFNLYDQLVGNIDCEGIPMTCTSPYHDEKSEIFQKVTQLWKVIEIQGAQLEKRYPNLFFRGNKSRWTKRFKEFAKKAETVSVLFKA